MSPRWLKFWVLQGDTSDNILVSPGVGPKTAADLVKEIRHHREHHQHSDELKGKLKERVEEFGQRFAFEDAGNHIALDAR